MEDNLREFRGYLNGVLKYTFPFHWVDNIQCQGDIMRVTYEDELKYNPETSEIVLKTIEVDSINIK